MKRYDEIRTAWRRGWISERQAREAIAAEIETDSTEKGRDSLTAMDTTETPFGHWSNTDERLEELRNRLAAWFVAGEQLPEIFTAALHKFTDILGEEPNPLEVPAEAILVAFEEALSDFDNILSHFREDPDPDNLN